MSGLSIFQDFHLEQEAVILCSAAKTTLTACCMWHQVGENSPSEYGPNTPSRKLTAADILAADHHELAFVDRGVLSFYPCCEAIIFAKGLRNTHSSDAARKGLGRCLAAHVRVK
jgi:hypothetical protein